MKLVVQVKLCPDRAQTAALTATLRACNDAADWVSATAFDRRIWRNYDLRNVCYGTVRSRWGLGAQAAQHVIKKVADAYASGDKRWRKGAARRRFRPMSAQPFDRRNLSWDLEARTVSIWTTTGRLRTVPFAAGDGQIARLAGSVTGIGETDLVFRDGGLYLSATVEVPEAPMNTTPAGWLGVDLGIVNIATTSDGTRMSGSHVNQVRHRNRRLRRKLQKKGTQSARRLLAKRSKKEARFAADVNHRVSKFIVAEAERTGRGIAREDLTGIRGRVRSRKPQRATLHSWSFAQLGAFIDYKALAAGVPVEVVDPAYTSQDCSGCGHRSRNNRPDQATFKCQSCGMSLHADENAALNIAARGDAGWAVSHAAERGAELAA